MKPLDFDEMPAAFVIYFAARVAPVSKHVRGRVGQKAAAKAHRRGTSGKAARRRQLAVHRASMALRVAQAKLPQEAPNGNQDR